MSHLSEYSSFSLFKTISNSSFLSPKVASTAHMYIKSSCGDALLALVNCNPKSYAETLAEPMTSRARDRRRLQSHEY